MMAMTEDALLENRAVFVVHQSAPVSDWKEATYYDDTADLVGTPWVWTPSGSLAFQIDFK